MKYYGETNPGICTGYKRQHSQLYVCVVQHHFKTEGWAKSSNAAR